LKNQLCVCERQKWRTTFLNYSMKASSHVGKRNQMDDSFF